MKELKEWLRELSSQGYEQLTIDDIINQISKIERARKIKSIERKQKLR
jgi:hypothetical protein